MKVIDVSICIVSWNTRDILKNCLRSIYDKTKKVSYEIIIVDNNSHDGTCEMVKEKFPECILIESSDNLGFVKGNNIAIREAKGRHLLYLNPDTELKTKAIDGMVKFLDKNPEYGAVGCKLVYPDNSIQYVCARTFPSPFNQFCFLAMLDRLFLNSKLFSTVEMRYWDHNNSRDIECLCGACILVRKEIIDQLQGFDEEIFMYAEDVDLCFRIKEKGWRIYYLSDEEIMHYAGASSKQHQKIYFSSIMQRESNFYFLNKHFGTATARKYLIAILIGSLVRLFVIMASFPLVLLSKRVRKNMPLHSFRKYLSLLIWCIFEKRFIGPIYFGRKHSS